MDDIKGNFKDEKVKLDLSSLLHLCIRRAQKGFFFDPVNCSPLYCLSYSNQECHGCVPTSVVFLFLKTQMSICNSFEKTPKSTEGVKVATVTTYILTLFQVFDK